MKHASRVVGVLVVAAAVCSAAAGAAGAAGDEPINLRVTPTVRVIEANREAVVNINTTQVVRQRFGPFGNDPFFREFFRGRRFERQVERTSLGSGFIIHPDGYIATNAHVVDDATEVRVNLADETTLEARVLASDAEHDLAIIKVDVPAGRTLEAVTLGDSSDLMQGEPAIAIGNPLGYHHSVSSGIVSATDRPLPLSRTQALEGVIQTDTPINPGSSGGPLLNIYGRVIGINTAIRGDAQNIGFAIPVNQLRALVPELLNPLAVNRVSLGGALTERRTVRPPDVVEVEVVWAPDDEEAEPLVVTHIDGTPVRDVVEASVALLALEEGSKAMLTTTAGRVELTARAPKVTDAQRLARSTLGLTPREPTLADRARMRLGDADGLLIESVERGGPADRAGIEPGDVVVQIGRFRVADLKRFALLLEHATASGADAVDLYILRRGYLGRARLPLRSEDDANREKLRDPRRL